MKPRSLRKRKRNERKKIKQTCDLFVLIIYYYYYHHSTNMIKVKKRYDGFLKIRETHLTKQKKKETTSD